MKNLFAIVWVLFAGGCIFGAPENMITGKAVHYCRQEEFGSRNLGEAKNVAPSDLVPIFRLNVFVLIRNTAGHAIKIATNPNQYAFLTSINGYSLLLKVANKENPWSVHIVVPECELGIVRLEPEEAAVIRWMGEAVGKKPERITIRYQVDEDVAKRYDLWWGELTLISKEGETSG